MLESDTHVFCFKKRAGPLGPCFCSDDDDGTLARSGFTSDMPSGFGLRHKLLHRGEQTESNNTVHWKMFQNLYKPSDTGRGALALNNFTMSNLPAPLALLCGHPTRLRRLTF